MPFGIKRHSDAQMRLIKVADVNPNPNQPRRVFDQEELNELASSIQQHGVLQPILVRPNGRGYELIAGERRLRAAEIAGLVRVPAVVQEIREEESALLALVENVQRENLSLLDEALAMNRLVKEFGLTQQEVARRMGRSQAGVANKLRLLKLDKRVWNVPGLTERHLRALLALPSGDDQVSLAQEAARASMTVRALEARISRRETLQKKSRRGRRVAALKDVRIFLNGFRAAVKTLQEAGVAAELHEVDDRDFVEVRVRIPKER